MKNAVIYARYSSDRQNEMSIEGQIEECRRYASEHDLLIVQEYIDRAQTATTDKRPGFLRMIDDSENGGFEIILVYQLDRFARNKNDSGYYKKILSDNGVRVLSAKEQIADDSSGIITEGLLEVVADYFSKQLSEKVTRGMYQRAEQCKFNGGNLTYGYAIDAEGYYILNSATAPVVREIFERTAAGENGRSIMDDFNARGIRTAKGKPFTKNSLQNILRNERYKGIYIFGHTRCEGGIPRIVSDELFEEVQSLLGNRARGHRPAKEDYLLSGKLYCGHCKGLMVGTSGTSQTGETYRYYFCKNTPTKCSKKNVRKSYIEKQVLETCQEMLSDDIIETVVSAVEKQNKEDQESPAIIRLKGEVKDVQVKIDNLIDQVEGGNSSSTITERLKQREEELNSLKKQLQKEQAKQVVIDPKLVRSFLLSLRNGPVKELAFQKMLVNALIDRIYLYDDHFLIMLHHSGPKSKAGKDEVREVEHYFGDYSSNESPDGVPINPSNFNGSRGFAYCCFEKC